MIRRRGVVGSAVTTTILLMGATALTVGGADFDADGYADLAVGVPSEDVGAIAGAGAVNILYGSEDGITSAFDQLFVQDDFGEVAERFDDLGNALAAGDFDGDGAVDLVIGVPAESIGNADGGGAIHVVYGSKGVGLTTSRIQYWHQGSPGIDGALETGDQFGNEVAVGDFDGDGYDDVAVGAPQEAIGDLHDAGAVNVIFGGPDGLSAAGNQIWWEGENGLPGTPEGFEYFGAHLSAGDFDADGHDDLAISVTGQDIGPSPAVAAGYVAVLYGTPAGLTGTGSQQWIQGVGGVPNVAEDEDRFGLSLTSGDFNGDGFADLGIGAPGEDWSGVVNAGAVVVLFGSETGLSADGAELWTDPDMEKGDYYGWPLASGDLDGDGYDELIVGISYEDFSSNVNCGAIEVLNGGPGGLVSDYPNGFWHQDRTDVLDSAEEEDQFGRALATGDFNHDGFVDLAIGVPFEDVGGAADAGAVQIFFGSASGLTAAGNQLWHQGSPGVEGSVEGGDYFGFALAAIPRSPAIFSDGFESGDTTQWSDEVP